MHTRLFRVFASSDAGHPILIHGCAMTTGRNAYLPETRFFLPYLRALAPLREACFVVLIALIRVHLRSSVVPHGLVIRCT